MRRYDSINQQASSRSLWDSSIADSPPEVAFDAVMSDSDEKGMAHLTRNIVSNYRRL